MNGAHLHLVLNHIPLLGLLFGAGILAWGAFRTHDAVVRVALGLFVIAALAAGGTYWSGEAAEDIVEGGPGVSHAAIEAHEEVALYALGTAIAVGLVALVALVLYRNAEIPRPLAWVVVFMSVIALSAMGYTANTGGKINHPELRTDSSVTTTAPAESDDHAE